MASVYVSMTSNLKFTVHSMDPGLWDRWLTDSGQSVVNISRRGRALNFDATVLCKLVVHVQS